MDNKKNIAEKIKKIILRSGAYDRERKYIDLYKCWIKTASYLSISDSIYDYIIQINKEKRLFTKSDINNLVLIVPDNIGGNLSIVPIGFKIAEKLGCNVAVWKELADIKWSKSRLLCDRISNCKCILLQDAVDQGTTAIKIVNAFSDLNWRLILYLAVVKNPYLINNIDITLERISETTGDKILFEYIASIDDF